MPSKRRRTNKMQSDKPTPKAANKRGRAKGKLAGTDDLPLDILHEIFSHLSPHDILRISRVSKVFRSHLLGPGGKPIWQAARRNTPTLPPALPGMSEPAFIDLVFEKRCANCSQTTTKQVDWALRTRLCGTCEKHSVSILPYWRAFGNTTLLDETDTRKRDGGDHATDTDESFISMIPHSIDISEKVHFLKTDLESIKANYDTIEDEEERQEFILRKQKESSEIMEASKAMKEWKSEQQTVREAELHAAREERKNDIVRRLTEAGWGDELAEIKEPHSLSDLEVVRRPQRLTDRIWRNIEPSLLDFLGKMRTIRIEHESTNSRSTMAIQYLHSYKLRHLGQLQRIPGPADFCAFAPVEALIKRPVDDEVTPGDFVALESQMPDLCGEWYHQALVKVAAAEKSHSLRFRMLDDFDMGDVETDEIEEKWDDYEWEKKLSSATRLWVCRALDCPLKRDTDQCQAFDPVNPFTMLASMCRGNRVYGCWDAGLGHHRSPPPMSLAAFVAHPCFSRQKSYLQQPFAQRENQWKSLDRASNNQSGQTLIPIVTWAQFSLHGTDDFSTKYGVDEHYRQMVELMLETMGMDPKENTVDDLDGLTEKFACLLCCEIVEDEPETCHLWVSGWREMLRHYQARHIMQDPDQIKFIPLSREVYQDATVVDSIEGKPAEWICLHCMDTPRELLPMTRTELLQHFRSDVHENDSPQDGVDYVRSPDSAKPIGMSNIERDTRQILALPISLMITE